MWKKVNWIQLIGLPSLVGVSLFYLIPLFNIVIMVVLDSGSKKAGPFQSLIEVLKNDAFLLASKNTILFLLVSIPLLMVLTLLFSYVMYETIAYFDTFKVWYIIPLSIPAAAMSLFWRFLFGQSGMLNSLIHQPIDWLNTNLSFGVIVTIFLWKNFGYMMILWLGGISKISKQMIEAARVDGASGFQVFFHVVLPQLKSTAFVVYLFSIINAFKIFRDIYGIAGNYPHEKMYLLQHLFNNWFAGMALQKMAAGGVLYLMAILVIVLPAQKYLNTNEERVL
ncbi:carbohydrate ABC transporter permease [Vagococcus silagei]|uniref:Sugar ABC transporter permease n=1 Tax=Vagococcus silagei TaxID=2508885 RepID=A0A4S3B4Z5_9ENTE|nr:sugar ABC transporter permease [Vagococcus silagei]THB60496.1 sugar ABC transporter permease [Vagococcus silagei]